jgi:hypothetical protein
MKQAEVYNEQAEVYMKQAHPYVPRREIVVFLVSFVIKINKIKCV